MKPIRLDMEYFGPFKNETIDFKTIDGQMFLISGKTGSGKTMIFDAITFALYGQTSTTDRDEDSVRSQFATDDDISKVGLEFRLGSSVYKVERELSFSKEGRKSRVPSKAALYGEDGSVIESSVTGVTAKIVEIIQLTAEQFRQILILPQGEFKRLLVSTSEDKQKILRTLFQTQRFVKFEEKLKELEKSEQNAMQHLEAKISEQLSTLQDNEEHPSFHHRLESLKQRITDTRTEAGRLDNKIQTARERRNALQEELKKKTAHNDKVSKLETLTEQQTQLESRSGKMKIMEQEIADYSRVTTISFELRRELELEQQIQASEKRLDTLNTDYNKVQSEYNTLQEELSSLLKNEDVINDTERFITRNERFLNRRYEALPADIEQLNRALEQQRAAGRQLEDAYKKLSKELENLTVSNADVDKMTSRKHELDLKKKDVGSALENEEKFSGYDKKIEAIREKMIENEKQHSRCQQNLDEIKSAVQAKYKAEDREHIDHLISHLQVGEACPVCQTMVEAMPESISYMSEDEEMQINDLHNQIATLDEEKSSLGQEEKLYTELLKGVERKPHKTLTDELTSLNGEADAVSEELKALRNNLERKEKVRDEMNRKSASLNEANIEIEKIGNRLSQLEEQLDEFKRETGFEDYAALQSHIEKLKREAESFRQNKKMLEERREALNNDFTKISQSIRHLEDSADNDKNIIQEMSTVVDGFLAKQPFLDRAELREILNQQDISTKEQQVRDFHREKSSTDMQIDALKKELPHTEFYNIEEDQVQIDKAEAEVEALHTELAVLNNNITQFQRVFDTVSEYIGDYEKKKDRHHAIHELVQKVGGNNHSKISLERYVLTYYLEKILNIANKRLLEMTNHRYALVRSQAAARRKTGLDIEVFDYYNNSSRHISSLSGGETFQASLSLALALSEAVQQEAGGISLDTMFIDEGFGTLDKETLEIAISTLIDLQSGGKTIGIISHVTELKERLNHILEVTSDDEISTAEFNL